VFFDRVKLKTVSVDAEAFRLLRREKGVRESYGDVVRRVFAERVEANYDPSDHLDQLFAEFGGKGVLTNAGRSRLRARKANPARSRRPGRVV
jgi:hypothetical protein